MTPDEISAALAAIQARNMQSLTAPQASGRRTRWTGPMPNRPVIDGKAVVTAEELADFRRQFGAEKTLRDLLNADRGAMPSAADMRARGVQGASYAPGVPGAIPAGGMAGPAAEGRIPGEVERNLINALMALGPMLGGMPAGVFARNALANASAAPAPVGMAPTLAQVSRDPRTRLPMQLPRPAEVYLQGGPTLAQVSRDPRTRAPMRLPEAYIPGVTR